MTFRTPFELFGLPVIRDGDKVLIIGKLPDPMSIESQMKSMQDMLDRSWLRTEDFDCPFDLLDQFEQWWEWHSRIQFHGDTA